MSYFYENGKRFRVDRDGDTVYVDDYDIEAENEKRKNEKLCPFMPSSTTIHNDRKNYMVPQHGFNKLINYDVEKVSFSPCIKERCAAYNSVTGGCKRLE